MMRQTTPTLLKAFTVFMGLAISLVLFDSRAARGNEWTDVNRSPQDGYILYEPPRLKIFELDSPPPVVAYLHGAPWLVQPESYDQPARDLAEAGCVVVLPIYNGLPSDWYHDAVAKTRRALIDIAWHRVGWWRPSVWNFALVGHSLGGVYALRMAHDAGSLGLPAPKALVLHDAAGFDSLPLVSPSPWTGTSNWLDDLTGVRNDALLVVIAATNTWIEDSADFCGGNASAVWLRAWHRTGLMGEKRAYLVPGDHFASLDLLGSGTSALYHEITVDALRHTFGSQPFPDPSGVPRVDWLLSLAGFCY